jgi:trehalose/maltose transport system permease protein
MAVDTRQEVRPARVGDVPVTLVGLLFVALGAGAIAIIVTYVVEVLNAPLVDPTFGNQLFLFLASYGILIPLLLVAASVYFIRMGLRLFQRHVTAAAWAHQLLLWIVIVLVVLAIQGFLAGANTTDAIALGLSNGLPFALLAVVCAVAYWWLGANMAGFRGQETLVETSARGAWNLLIPTLFVLVIVAARPLEETFITSLTNQRFAGGADYETQFIGLQNYAKLLGVRFDLIQCVTDEATGGCAVNADGATVFPRPRDALDEGYMELRYRDVFTVPIGNSAFVFSARDRDFWNSVGNTLYFTVASVSLELLLGLGIALIINSKFKGRGLLRTAMLVPWAIPTVVSARLWELMLRDNSSGFINMVLLQLGLIAQPQAWLANPALQIPALIMVDVWKTTPFMALILLAGLQVIPSDIYEAADVDGASKTRQFFRITLPLLTPAIAIALVFRTLDAVRVFDLFQVLLGRAKLSMATYNHEQLVNNQDGGYASAIGVVIFIIILIFTVIYTRTLNVKAE